MTSFDSAKHPRASAGTFSEKTQSEPEAALVRGTVLHTDAPSSVDTITQDGLDRGTEALVDVSSLERWQADMVMQMVVRDWSHGNEGQAMKALSSYTDLTGQYRVVAAMKSSAT
jgi:hypothetical protein